MDRLDTAIGDALRRIETLTGIARWLWCVNLIVMIAAIANRRYDVSAVAAFTWLLALIAAAIGRIVTRHLNGVRQTIHSS